MKCPKCGSENCQIFTESETTGKDFSAGKGCLGYLLFGKIGLLCGLCGEGQKTKTRQYWICNYCGHKWKV